MSLARTVGAGAHAPRQREAAQVGLALRARDAHARRDLGDVQARALVGVEQCTARPPRRSPAPSATMLPPEPSDGGARAVGHVAVAEPQRVLDLPHDCPEAHLAGDAQRRASRARSRASLDHGQRRDERRAPETPVGLPTSVSSATRTLKIALAAAVRVRRVHPHRRARWQHPGAPGDRVRSRRRSACRCRASDPPACRCRPRRAAAPGCR